MSNARITEKLGQNSTPSSAADVDEGMNLCTRFGEIFMYTACGLKEPKLGKSEVRQLIIEIKHYVESHPNKKDSLLKKLEAEIEESNVSLIVPYCVIQGGYYDKNCQDRIILDARYTSMGVMGMVDDYIENPQQVNENEKLTLTIEFSSLDCKK